MRLTMRPTGGHSPVYTDRQDWTVINEGQPVGRISEDTAASTSTDLRWSWSSRSTSGRMPASPQAGRRQHSTRPRLISAQLDRLVEAGDLGAVVNHVVVEMAPSTGCELNRILVALVHGFGHPVARHLQKLFPKLLISRKSGKPHALASVAHALLISGHRTPP
jgi:hypothetical protein